MSKMIVKNVSGSILTVSTNESEYRFANVITKERNNYAMLNLDFRTGLVFFFFMIFIASALIHRGS
jgi:hypothetical protein